LEFALRVGQLVSAIDALVFLESRALAVVLAVLLGLGDLEEALQLVVAGAIGQVLEDEGLLHDHEACRGVLVTQALHKLLLGVGEEVDAELERDAVREVRGAKDSVHLHGVLAEVGALRHFALVVVVLDVVALDAERRLPILLLNLLLLRALEDVVGLQLLGVQARPAPLAVGERLIPPDRGPGEERHLKAGRGALLELSEDAVLVHHEVREELVLQQVGVGLHDLHVLSPLVGLVQEVEVVVGVADLSKERGPVDATDERHLRLRKRARETVHFDECVKGRLLERKGTIYGQGDATSIFMREDKGKIGQEKRFFLFFSFFFFVCWFCVLCFVLCLLC
jgi:hypothetical protein